MEKGKGGGKGKKRNGGKREKHTQLGINHCLSTEKEGRKERKKNYSTDFPQEIKGKK